LFNLLNSSHVDLCTAVCLLWAHAASNVLLTLLIKVKAQLSIQLLLHGLMEK
jgi:hypothetical protein